MKSSRVISAPSRSVRAGFTLIELLTVIAIIGIMAAITIPTMTGVRASANKAKTKVQFSQWAAALEGFRSEYGYYPVLDDSNLINPPGQSVSSSALHVFHDLLAARRRNGEPLPVYGSGTGRLAPEAQNRKLICFYFFGESDLDPSALLQDAFGNTEIAVLVDRNLDGVIRVGGANADYASTPLVAGAAPTMADFPATGVRAGVLFYAPGPGSVAGDPQFILSWK
jgi:prepilin-type N-terminal cleavage/methylation domain-containing protein